MKIGCLHKQIKFWYLVKNAIRYILPEWYNKYCYTRLQAKYDKLSEETKLAIKERVDYYCQVTPKSKVRAFQDDDFAAYPKANKMILVFGALRDVLRKPKEFKYKVYFIDAFATLRLFDKSKSAAFMIGDVNVPACQPAFVKSRPIGNSANSVMLKLDECRHFRFVDDPVPFEKKKDLLLGRASVYQENRKRFYWKYFGHPLCDLGQVNTREVENYDWIKPPMSIREHLEYKFILCLEGNDVATNLKWVMSSNSLAVMPKPTMEIWFMEGRLIGGYHYIEIKDDYSDLEEKLNYYINNPEEAKEIVRHANEWTAQFRNEELEDIVRMKTAERYFENTTI